MQTSIEATGREATASQQEIAQVRTDMEEMLAGLQREVDGNRQEIVKVRAEIDGQRIEMGRIGQQCGGEHEELLTGIEEARNRAMQDQQELMQRWVGGAAG